MPEGKISRVIYVLRRRLRLAQAVRHENDLLVHQGNRIQAHLLEAKNQLSHLDSSLQSRLNTFENEIFPELLLQIHNSAAIQLAARARATSHERWRPPSRDSYSEAQPVAFDEYLELVRRDFPSVYPAWEERLKAVQNAFMETKRGNAANLSDLFSRMFRSLVQSEAGGRILDVGCGIFGRPFYLDFYPADLISGIDPLPQLERADFEFVQGLSEYLPWPDHSFSTVISATSLDHCLSLDRSVAELLRVVRPDGIILLWIGSIPGSARYEPDAPDFTPSDKFHLFHFDQLWFDPYLAERAEVVEKLEFKASGFSHVFYTLRSKEPRQVGEIPQTENFSDRGGSSIA